MNNRVYRWTGNLDFVLISDNEGNLWLMECRPDQKFIVLEETIHPSGYPCLLGEFVYGKDDGKRFYFEPKAEEFWNEIAKDVTD